MRRLTSISPADSAVVLASLLLVVAAAVDLLPASLLEAAGFATGAVSVWLVVRESTWTWPVGIANNVVFVVLFFEARLFADMALQFVYVALSLLGWWYWLHGGEGGRRRRVGRVGAAEAAVLGALTAAATLALTLYLRAIGDSAPFLDALTTCLSLAATYLMARKLIDNWFVWIAADVVYIPLYVWKSLPLTAILYTVFLVMCVRGVFAWRASIPRFRHAVVAGKFYPFHAGHKFLISQATKEAARVTVLVCGTSTQAISAAKRAAWVKATFPAADVVTIDEDALGLDDSDSEGWARATLSALGGLRPDAVFSSEEYGDAYAAALGAVHRLVDRERVTVPVSGTAIRNDPLRHLAYLDPHVRAHFVLRVCLVGAESTGKTTLAALLADRYETVWVREYGREYSERTGKQLGDEWTTNEFRHIADVQTANEDELAQVANGILVCDTDVFTTARFHEVYVGAPDAELERRARARRYDLYLLCGLDAPFVQDGWRADGPHRAAMDAAYRRHLAESGTPWVELRGSIEERLARASAAIEELIASSAA